MTWNLSAECIAFIFVCIIFLYSRKSYSVPSLKNKIFQICLLTTICSIGFNILSTFMLAYASPDAWSLTWMVTTLYFWFTPLLGMVYYYYSVSVVFEDQTPRSLFMIASAIPYIIYFCLVVLNFWTKNIFYLDSSGNYYRGKYIVITYVIFYIYCVACFVLVMWRRSNVDSQIRSILMYFPLLAVLVIAIQQRIPEYILSGSAAACSLLMVYLYLQNKRISVDILTGISNRQEFSKMIELKHKQKGDNAFDVIVLSINSFKIINDKFGYQHGDRLLKDFSEYLKSVTTANWLYRYSGDQFAILMEKNQRMKTNELLDTIVNRMKNPWEIGGYRYLISVSIGIVKYPEVANNLQTIINGIEYAVAKAKKSNGITPCFCTNEMLEEIRRRTAISEILRETLDAHKFEVYYQPIWSIEKKKFVAAEALARLNNTKFGNISPGEFIPIAEDTGVIIDITYQILDTVCKFIKSLMDEGIGDNIEGIAVNFSAISFMQNDLAEKVLEIINKNEIPYSKIKIEITESVLISNEEKVKAFILYMQEKGIKFSLDDFGTGHSNISTVIELPFDTVKLDKSIVWSSVKMERSNGFLKFLIRALKEVDKNVLAEGVESERQDHSVEECGCEYIQGFRYARPVTALEAKEYFKNKAPLYLNPETSV